MARTSDIEITFSEAVTAAWLFVEKCRPRATRRPSPATASTLTWIERQPSSVHDTVAVDKGAISDVDASIPDHVRRIRLSVFVAANLAPTDISLSNASIDENQPSGTDVGTLTTTDPDAGDTHTYTLESSGCGGGRSDNSSFQIGGVNSDKLQSAGRLRLRGEELMHGLRPLDVARSRSTSSS